MIKVKFKKQEKSNIINTKLKNNSKFKKIFIILFLLITIILFNVKQKPNIINYSKKNYNLLNNNSIEQTSNILNMTKTEKTDNIPNIKITDKNNIELENEDNTLNNNTKMKSTDDIIEIKKKENKRNTKIKINVKKKNNITNNKKINQQKNLTNYIHLALNIDNKYVYPCLVYLTSLLSNRANSTFYIIHILIGDSVKNSSLYKFKSTIEVFGNNFSNVSFYNMGDQFKGATSGRYISTAAYYRISLPSLLPEVNKIIYTDSDVINFKDLSEMYNIEFKNNMYYCGPLDFIGHLDELRRLGVYTDKYINTGILLINLKALRNNSIEQKIRNFVSSHFLNHHEQTAINTICYNNTQVLSYKYASFVFNSYDELLQFKNKQNEKYKYIDNELNESFYNPTLIHFPGYTKPWERKCTNIKRVFWWYYAKKSIYYQEILNNYGFNNEEIEQLLKNIREDGHSLKINDSNNMTMII